MNSNRLVRSCVSLSLLALPLGSVAVHASDASAVNPTSSTNNAILASDKATVGITDGMRALLGTDYDKFRAVTDGQIIPNSYIVVYQDDSITEAATKIAGTSLDRLSSDLVTDLRAQAVTDMTSSLASTYGIGVTNTYGHALGGFAGKMDDKALASFIKDSRVAYIEQNQIMSTVAVQNNATWGLDRIDEEDRPLDGFYEYNFDGSGVDAYVIDTGVLASHNNFGGRVSSGFTAINDGRGSNDCNGHGTHVAGTMGSTTWGVAKNVNLVAVRVLGCNGSGTNAGVIDGVDYVAQVASGPSVANMSLGGGNSTALDNAVEDAIDEGVTFVVAAGNSNANACSGSPNRVGPALTVGSTTSSDSRSSFSNRCLCC